MYMHNVLLVDTFVIKSSEPCTPYAPYAHLEIFLCLKCYDYEFET